MVGDTETPGRETIVSRFLRNWHNNAPQYGSPRYLAINAALFLAYLVSGRLGMPLAYLNPSATPVWPPTGIALAAFLLLGYRVWPAIFTGAFCVNWTLTGSVATSTVIALGNLAEGLLGAYLVNRFAGGTSAFSKVRSIFRYAFLAGLLSTSLSATLGVTSLLLSGLAQSRDYGVIWLTWWLGDAVGDLIVAPLLLLWFTAPPPRWDRRKLTEALALGLYFLLVGVGVFGSLNPAQAKNFPLEFLCIPFLIWAALRFSQQEAAVSVLMLSAISIGGTLSGYGPFVMPTANESLLLLQAFLGVVGLMTHSVAAVVSEHHRAQEALREARDELAEKAVSDPLTGLANYRRFVDVFDAEAERSQRTERSFALVLFDVDDLKKINDSYGHLTGTRALCRVGNTMRVYCRTIDTAVRYGGDEFALLLPETETEGAYQVARRIAAQVAGDGETPAISVSFGIAVYPADGRSIEEVFGKADAALYRMKRGTGQDSLETSR
jgi:diguanylate cyclase (GGDEF)-like protein